MTIEDVRKLTDSELSSKVFELKANLLNLRFQAKAGQLDNGNKIRECRKDIARCLTVEGERRREKANEAAKEVVENA